MMKTLDAISLFITSHPFITFFLSLCSIHLVEISPLKINPLQWSKRKVLNMFKSINRAVNEDINKKIEDEFESINNDIDEMRISFKEYKEEQERERIRQLKKDAKQLRRLILDFYDSLLEQSKSGEIHKSKRSFEQVLFSNVPEYLGIMDALGLQNGLIDSATEYITEVYERLRRTNGFEHTDEEYDDDTLRSLFNLEIKCNEEKE